MQSCYIPADIAVYSDLYTCNELLGGPWYRCNLVIFPQTLWYIQTCIYVVNCLEARGIDVV
jgi:hypothetical protein